MKFKKIQSTLLSTLLACSLITVPVLATPDTEVNQYEVEKQELEGQKAAVEEEVNGLQAQLNTLMITMNELSNQLIEKGQQIMQAEEDLAAAEAEEESQYEDMKLRIRYMYEEGSTSVLERVFSSANIAEVLSQAEYFQKVHTYDREKLDQYADTVREVEDLKAELVNDREELEGIQSQYEAQSVELAQVIETKSAEVDNLDEQIQEAARKAAEEEERRRQEEERKKKEEEERRKKEEEDRRQQEEARKRQEEERRRQQEALQQSQNNLMLPSQTTQTTQSFVPDYNQSAAEIIIAAAYSQLNVPYVWGGTTPFVGFDCSGLVQWCYAQAGISIPRTDITQLNAGTIVSDPMPGDICWTPGHVAIYIGNGQMIEAQQTGVPICVSRVRVTYYVRY